MFCKTKALNVRIDQLNKAIARGEILQAMEEFYDDNVTMTEPYHTTQGKDANIEREKKFLASVKEWKNCQVLATAVNGNTSLSQQVMDWVAVDGSVMHVEQVAVAQWHKGKIVHERFYYNMA